ncbi:metal ABC transporter solute-binding protein, Zn/Mn family [Calidithermus chliarophilus]|uniref:Periplasmic solute binding protein n=2 Tax=Allomeiothermus silvanus TaxID=52022 RepID=D7BB44_ALLS1|nr:zinc ABC transporter substrate-binding protein [Calidithermus chliarophilus]ADH62604.1 periplasmic solute binding protein [Allomeiothermus silvanus DSM 9946]
MKALHLWALALVLLLSACQVQDFALRPIDGDRPVRAVATANFVTDLVQQIGGERVQVTGLMGPGVDPHLYKASAGDVRKLTQADVVFYSGLFLEGKMVELFEKMPKAIAITDAIPHELLIAPEGGFEGTYTYDPHVWFDVSLWAHTAEAVRDGLSKVDPAGAGYYAERTRQYQARLQELDAWVKQEIGRIPPAQRVMVTAHDAFGYFGRRYGLEVRGLQGVSTVAETGTRDVQELAAFLAERGIRAIFVESSVPRRSVEAVVAAVRARGKELRIGGELFSDAAGDPGTPEGTYVGMVEHNVRTIVSALLGGEHP